MWQVLNLRYVIICFCLSLFSFEIINAQTRIEDAIKAYSKKNFKNIDELVSFISANADNEKEKAYGAYYWIATNITYDVRKFLKGKPSYFQPEKVFEKKKAVCEGYSNLYKRLCNDMGIRCEIVSGYSKGYGYQRGKKLVEADHAWNALYLDSTWKLVDVTWAAGSIKKKLFARRFITDFNNDFFYYSPKEFVVTHLPEIPMWQLLENPINVKLFSGNNDKVYAHFKNNPEGDYHYNDTIDFFFSKEKHERTILFGKMALAFNPLNTVPLAIGVIVPYKQQLENDYYNFLELGINEIDSLIKMTDNAIDLLKQSRSSKRSIKELIETNLIVGHEVISEFYYIKSELLRKKAIQGEAPFKEILARSEAIITALEKAVENNRNTKNLKQFVKVDKALCDSYAHFLGIYKEQLSSTQKPKERKSIQRQISELERRTRRVLKTENSCYNTYR